MEVIEGSFEDRDMVCPFRTEVVNFQTPNGEVHQQNYFMPCYKSECPFYKNGVCRKVEVDL